MNLPINIDSNMGILLKDVLFTNRICQNVSIKSKGIWVLQDSFRYYHSRQKSEIFLSYN